MQLFHRYFTFLVGVRTQKAFIFCQQQYVAVFGRLNLDNLNVLGIFFHIIVDGMKALMPFIEQIEFTVDSLNPQKTILIFYDALNFTRRNVCGIKAVMVIVGTEFTSVKAT